MQLQSPLQLCQRGPASALCCIIHERSPGTAVAPAPLASGRRGRVRWSATSRSSATTLPKRTLSGEQQLGKPLEDGRAERDRACVSQVVGSPAVLGSKMVTPCWTCCGIPPFVEEVVHHVEKARCPLGLLHELLPCPGGPHEVMLREGSPWCVLAQCGKGPSGVPQRSGCSACRCFSEDPLEVVSQVRLPTVAVH